MISHLSFLLLPLHDFTLCSSSSQVYWRVLLMFIVLGEHVIHSFGCNPHDSQEVVRQDTQVVGAMRTESYVAQAVRLGTS